MKQAAIRRLASEPDGVPSTATMVPTRSMHTNMTLAPKSKRRRRPNLSKSQAARREKVKMRSPPLALVRCLLACK